MPSEIGPVCTTCSEPFGNWVGCSFRLRRSTKTPVESYGSLKPSMDTVFDKFIHSPTTSSLRCRPVPWGDRRHAESTGLSRHSVHPSLQTQSSLSDAGIARLFRTLLISASDPFFHHDGDASPGSHARAIQHSTAFSDSVTCARSPAGRHRVKLKTASKPVI